ncbi:hypothetical protein C8Q80DRAFT_1272681 [Daedaleopsis nitida]|nr:hypothetical protein C8Q80DRAFT_1272681 [Daedaleopsis nitida]
MTLGPPPSAAGPSQNLASASLDSTPHQSSSTTTTTTVPSSVSAGPYTSQFSVQPQTATRSYFGAPHNPAFAPQPGTPQTQNYVPQNNYYTQPLPGGTPQAPAGAYPYYGYPPNAWANAWNQGTYQYPTGGAYSPSPPPSHPEYHRDWDAIIKSFLSAMGLTQALRGFEADMLVLNPEWERKRVPSALAELMKDLLNLGQAKPDTSESESARERSLDERKLDYVHAAPARSQTSTMKEISRFLAQNRARNDASNRNEFLLSLAEKRRRLNDNGDAAVSPPPSCARTDAKTQNRDLQMKYDIAKNEDGPLRRTMKAVASPQGTNVTKAKGNTANATANALTDAHDYPSAERYPALDERVQNIEKHLAVRYVPLPPRSLLDRLKFLEDHLIHLEKEYPPWAALHFNQPNRGWPPPPRATPIIVPSHLTSTATRDSQLPVSADARPDEPQEGNASKAKGKQIRTTKSSLHRAVMERLEVQKAMNDLAGPSSEG